MLGRAIEQATPSTDEDQIKIRTLASGIKYEDRNTPGTVASKILELMGPTRLNVPLTQQKGAFAQIAGDGLTGGF